MAHLEIRQLLKIYGVLMIIDVHCMTMPQTPAYDLQQI